MSKSSKPKSQAQQNCTKPSKRPSWSIHQKESFDAVWGILQAHYTLDDISEWTGNVTSPGWWSHVKHGHFEQIRMTDERHNSVCAAWLAIKNSSSKMPGLIKRELSFNAALAQAMQAKDELVKYTARYGR